MMASGCNDPRQDIDGKREQTEADPDQFLVAHTLNLGQTECAIKVTDVNPPSN